jgi:NAD+ synthase (glutamine-hydrolysing)
LTEPPPRLPRPELPAPATVVHDDIAEVYQALVVGTRDYVHKNGFRHAVLGLSGGIDSALVATIAVDALGADAVTGVALPSRYSSEHARDDATDLAARLGIDLLTVPIEQPFVALSETLAPVFVDRAPDVTEENLQARVRGVLLMALSNKFGWLLLTTGNKSELATGYSTLYGDMAGGFAVIKDVPKTLAYTLARWRNARDGDDGPIPQSSIDKPPSAELRPDQHDTDSLPPYDVLDPILERYVEQDWSIDEIVAAGYDDALVRRIVRLVDASEYKRRQAAPGVKITTRAFGKDRRLPITGRFNW